MTRVTITRRKRDPCEGDPARAPSVRGVAVLVAGLVAGWAACAPSEEGGARGTAAGETAAGEPASRTVSDARFRTLSGEWASLADYRGRVVILNLWGTWCLPCRREIPELVEVQRAFGERGVTVIGLAIDSGGPEEIRAFADGYGVQYPIWTTDMATALTEFQAVGYPFTLLIARDGTIRHQFYGPQSLESLAPKIEALLD